MGLARLRAGRKGGLGVLRKGAIKIGPDTTVATDKHTLVVSNPDAVWSLTADTGYVTVVSAFA